MIDRDEESQGVIQSLSMPVVTQPRHRDHFSRTLHVSCNTPAREIENEGELAWEVGLIALHKRMDSRWSL